MHYTMSPIVAVVVAFSYVIFTVLTVLHIRVIKQDRESRLISAALIVKCSALAFLFMSWLIPDHPWVSSMKNVLGSVAAASLILLIMLNYPKMVADLLAKRG